VNQVADSRPDPEPPMGRTVAICQPNFLPWMGYFEMADRADVFVMLDDVQFIRRHWTSRNRITKPGTTDYLWLSVPLKKAPQKTPINEMVISHDDDWQSRMLKSLRRCYAKAPFLDSCFPAVERTVCEGYRNLVDLNISLIRLFCELLGIPDNLVLGSSLPHAAGKGDALVDICERLGADVYLANNGSKPYIEPQEFLDRGIGFVFQDYEHPEYPRGKGGFVPYLSVVDVLFWHGPRALEIIRKGRRRDWRDGIRVSPATSFA